MARAMDSRSDTLVAVAAEIATSFATVRTVEAVTLVGTSPTAITASDADIKLCVYSRPPIATVDRNRVIQSRRAGSVPGGSNGSGDRWVERDSGVWVGVTYRDPLWVEAELRRVVDRHEASFGCSTEVWHDVLASHLLFDRNAWFDRLRQPVKRPYPEALVRSIVAKNYPVLRSAQSASPGSQKDVIDAILASYFDILFAVNHEPHPGTRQLLDTAELICARLPMNMRTDITALEHATPIDLTDCLNAVVQGLDVFLQEHCPRLLVTTGEHFD